MHTACFCKQSYLAYVSEVTVDVFSKSAFTFKDCEEDTVSVETCAWKFLRGKFNVNERISG